MRGIREPSHSSLALVACVGLLLCAVATPTRAATPGGAAQERQAEREGPTLQLRAAGGALLAERTVVVEAEGDPFGRFESMTSTRGEVRLPAEWERAGTVRVRVPGFEPSDVPLPSEPGADPLVLVLDPVLYTLEEVVATGTRVGTVAPGVQVQSIDGTSLRAGRSENLAAALADQAGIEMEAGHPVGAGVMVQGMDGRRVLVLVDGEPLVGRLSGVQDLSRIPLAAVREVEIVRGPQAALYGSEALGGVINILTREASREELAVRVGGTVGSGDRASMNGELTGTAGGVGYLLGGSHRGDGLVPGVASGGEGAIRNDLRLRLSSSGRRVRWESSALLMLDEVDWRSGQLAHRVRGRQWSGQLRAGGGLGDGRWTAAASAAGLRQHSGRAPVGNPLSMDDDRFQEERGLELEAVVGHPVGLADWSFDIEGGVELRKVRVAAERVEHGSQEEMRVEGFAQASLPVRSVTLVPAFRTGVRTGDDPYLIPEAALRMPVGETGSLVVRSAGGYRVADLKERAMTFVNIGPGFGYTVRGNPELRPERSIHLGADLQIEVAGTEIGTRVFWNRFRDFIATEAVGDSAGIDMYRYSNAERGRTVGAELDLARSIGPMRLDAGVALLSARDTGLDRPLLGRAPHTLRFGLTHGDLPLGFGAGFTLAHTASTPVGRSGDRLESRAALTRLDARVFRSLLGGVDASATVTNLLDQRPEFWPSSMQRRVHLTLTWNAWPR